MNIRRSGVYTGHAGPVYTVKAWGKSFISSGSDGVVAVWNFSNPDEGQPLVRVNHVVYSMAALAESNVLLLGQDKGGIHVVDLETNKEVKLLQYSNAPVFALKKVPEKNMFVSLDGEGFVLIMDSLTYKIQKKIKVLDGKLRAVTFSEKGDMAAIGASDGSIYIFNNPEWELIHKLKAHTPGFSVNTLMFSPVDGNLISGSRDAHLKVFDPQRSFDLIHAIPAHNYAIYAVEFSPENAFFATASRDKTIKIWDAASYKFHKRIDSVESEGHINSVNALLWHPDGQLVSGSDDRSLMSWRLLI